MPLTAGIHWELKNEKCTKKVLMSGVSLGQVEYLTWLQQTNKLIDKAGNRCPIHHAYFQGEKIIDDYSIDGYYECDGEKVGLEYQGKIYTIFY